MPEPEEIDVPFKGMIVTPRNAVVLIIEDKNGKDLTKTPDGVEVEVTFSARVVRDGVEEEANKHILHAAISMVAALADRSSKGAQ